jgi:6-phosphofructokinase 1
VGDLFPLGARAVGGIIEQGGTILQSARCPAFATPEGRAQAADVLRRWRIEGLIVIGGNGSQTGSHLLHEMGVAVNGVASTIDNDLCGPEITIGVDTALNVALESMDRLRTTAASHGRLSVVEVMGRDCGYLALAAGLAGGAEVIVTPEMDLTPEEVVAQVHEAHRRGKKHALVVVAEGARNQAQALCEFLKGDPQCAWEPRLTILGHVQRGGRPTAFDRVLATRLAARATELLLEGQAGSLIGLVHNRAAATPLARVVEDTKPLPSELLQLAATMKL